MKETGVFTISLELDMDRIKNLPMELDRIFKEVQDIMNNVFEKLSRETGTIDPEIRDRARAAFGVLITILGLIDAGERLGKIINFIWTNIGPAYEIAKDIANSIKEAFEAPPSDFERLDAIEEKGKKLIAFLEGMEKKIKANEGGLDSAVLSQESERLRQQIELVQELLVKTARLREELKYGALKGPGAGPLTVHTPFKTEDVIIKIDPIKQIEKELDRIDHDLGQRLEEVNKLLEERSQLLPPLQNAYASLEGPLSTITIGEGMMSDAMRGGTVSAVELGKKGIDPLAEKVSTFSGSFGDVVNAIGDGAVVFGYVVERAGKAEETLGTLNSTTGDLSARSKELADEQEHVTQAVADGSAVMDNAGASAEQFGDALEQVESSGGFFDGIKQGFIDFVENVESNSELMADFFADTLSNMSQNFSDFFYNAVTGKFESLADVAKNAFKSILKSFLDMVSAIATRQIVISIGGLFGIGKSAQAAGGGGNAADIAQQGAGVVGSGLGLFGSGGAFATLGAGLGFETSASAVVLNPATLLPTGEIVGPGFLATAGSAITIVGAALAAAALVATIVLPLLKKTPRFAFKFESVETEVGERAALVKEFLDADFFSEEIFKKIVGRGGGGAFSGKEVDELKKAIQKAIEETVNSVQEIINKLPTEMSGILNEALLNTAVDMETKIGRSDLLGFDAKGKKIAEKFQAFIEGELPAKFFASIRESFFDPAFRALGVSAEGTEALIDDFMAKMEAAGSREARAEVGAEFIATFNAFVDAFNIVSGNVNDAIGERIRIEEMGYRMAA